MSKFSILHCKIESLFYSISKSFVYIISNRNINIGKLLENSLVFNIYLSILFFFANHYGLNIDYMRMLWLSFLFLMYCIKLKDKKGSELIYALVILTLSFAVRGVF